MVLVAVGCQKHLLYLQLLSPQLGFSSSQWRAVAEGENSATDVILFSYHESCLPHISVLMLVLDLFNPSHFLMPETQTCHTLLKMWLCGCFLVGYSLLTNRAAIILGLWVYALSRNQSHEITKMSPNPKPELCLCGSLVSDWLTSN